MGHCAGSSGWDCTSTAKSMDLIPGEGTKISYAVCSLPSSLSYFLNIVKSLCILERARCKAGWSPLPCFFGRSSVNSCRTSLVFPWSVSKNQHYYLLQWHQLAVIRKKCYKSLWMEFVVTHIQQCSNCFEGFRVRVDFLFLSFFCYSCTVVNYQPLLKVLCFEAWVVVVQMYWLPGLKDSLLVTEC